MKTSSQQQTLVPLKRRAGRETLQAPMNDITNTATMSVTSVQPKTRHMLEPPSKKRKQQVISSDSLKSANLLPIHKSAFGVCLNPEKLLKDRIRLNQNLEH
jgi:hypothetical protein